MQKIKDNNYRNIVIVGGSHSGFSCAWMILNGPATYKRNNSLNHTSHTTFPDAPLKNIPNCDDCCTCDEAKRKKDPKNCSCQCTCVGYFSYKDWEFDYENDLVKEFPEASIKILYRDKIRVFYNTVKVAKSDGYTQYNEQTFSNPNGFLYSYTGLRGDSRRLYYRIRTGAEKRVQCIKTPTPQDQAKYLREADLVIWACGFTTNPIPIKDQEG
jgi:hypothetical protein